MINLLNTKPDPTLKDFYEDKDRCADLINCLCFYGKDVVKAKDIQKEPNEESTLFDETDSIYSFHAYRDIMIRLTENGYFVFIGIENQQNIDILISLREFLYTAFNYNRQYRNYQRESRNKRKLGLPIEKFKLIPVVTPVLYFGEDEWNENHYISELMENIPDIWKSLINDWHTRVIDIKKINTSLFKHKDNKDLFEGIVKVYESKGDLQKLSHMKVSRDTAILIATITQMKELVNIIQENESEEIDMCRSWEIFKENEIRIPLEREIKKAKERITEEYKEKERQMVKYYEDKIMAVENQKIKAVENQRIKIENMKSEIYNMKLEISNEIQKNNNIMLEANNIMQEADSMMIKANNMMQEANNKILIAKSIIKEADNLKLSIIINILNGKLGYLSEDIVTCIEKCSMEKLDLLLKQIFHIENEKDILTIVNEPL